MDKFYVFNHKIFKKWKVYQWMSQVTKSFKGKNPVKFQDIKSTYKNQF